jgi:hypothetical protein
MDDLMAVPPLPSNTTATLFLDYSFQGEGHTMQFRHASGQTVGALIARVQTFLQALDEIMDPTWEITGARYRAAGSIVALPVEPPADPVPTGTALPQTSWPRYVSFSGRGATTGRQVTIFVYGLSFPTPSNYRLEAGENITVDAARTVLDSSAAGLFTDVAGSDPIWKQYANVGFNSYHERQQRT